MRKWSCQMHNTVSNYALSLGRVARYRGDSGIGSANKKSRAASIKGTIALDPLASQQLFSTRELASKGESLFEGDGCMSCLLFV